MKDRDGARKIGLARALSKLGYCSGSRAAVLIRAGRVTLNRKIRRDPETPASEKYDRLAVDGKSVEQSNKLYLMMNKPRGVITTASDEDGRDTVYTVLRGYSAKSCLRVEPWVGPVGRLDKASEGLLLLTNDSEWAARIIAPQSHLDKTYHVQVRGVLEDESILALLRGVKVTNGEMLQAKRVRRLRSGEKTCWLEIILDEGRNRQIRRMIEALGGEVLRLIRVAVGPLPLGELAKGALRPLTAKEKRILDRAMQK
ncbi:MAG: pseudouridine synthase [Candidatus Sulfotelmatobacter sp.]